MRADSARARSGPPGGLCYNPDRWRPAIALLSYFEITPFPDLPLEGKLMVAAIVILALGAHEAAHAWTALKCGDPTGRDQGRITLNPIPHIDPFMTIVMPIALMLTTGWIFGGAKPVPVNFYNLRRPHRDMALVAIAGPLANVLAALLLFAGLHVVDRMGTHDGKVLPQILFWAGQWNLLLAAFNLLPIPPLDGSRVMTWILPRSLRPGYVALERYGMLILFGLLIFGGDVLWGPIRATMEFLYRVIAWIVTLGGLW